MEKMLKKLLASALAIALLLTTLNITVFADDEPATVATETTEEPTAEPSEEPTVEKTGEPAAEPSEEPTVEKTEEPAAEPSEEPAVEKTEEPATEPTEEPVEEPVEEPAEESVEEPAEEPTGEPVAAAASLDESVPITTGSSQPDAQPSVDPTKCDHRLTWVDGETVHPTSCAERGYIIQRMKCQNCGEVISEWKEYQDEKIDHVFVEKQIKGECIGSKTVRVCENCGRYETIDEDEYSKHDWVEMTAEVSCSDQPMGPVKWEECSRCHMRQNERYSLYTHTYNSGKKEVLAEATCTSSGWMRLTCDCEKSTRLASIEKLGHAWDDENGIEEAATCEHGTRTVRTCTRCGAKEVVGKESNDRLEHQWKIDAEQSSEATCEAAGKTVEVCALCKKTRETNIPRQPHIGDLVGDSEGHRRICKWCEQVIEGTEEEHHFTDEPVFQKADEKRPDRWAIVCINCGYEKSYTEDHKHTWKWESDDTNHWQVCTGCGTTKEKEEEWPHRWTWIDGDCTKGRECSVCGRIDESAACEEHTFTAWMPDTVADNEGNQTHTRKCTVCGTIETAKHEYEWKTTRTPTPEQMGLEVGTCTQCGSQATRDLLKTEPTPTPTPGEITAGEATEAKPTATPEGSEITPSEPTPKPGVITPDEPTKEEPTTKPTEEPTPKPGVITPDEPTKEEPTTKPTEEPEETPKPEITPSEPDEVTSGEPKKDEATSEPTEEPKPTPKPEITPSEPTQDESASESAAAPAEEPTQAPAAPSAPEAPAAPAQSGARTAAALASKTVEELIASETVTVSESVTVALRPIADAVVAGDAPEGELVVRAAVVTDAQNAESDVYAAFAAAWQRDGELVAIEPVTVSIPVSVGEADGEGMSVPTEAFKLVRVDTVDGEETLTEIEFTFEGGMLTFEMDAAAVYLIIPA